MGRAWVIKLGARNARYIGKDAPFPDYDGHAQNDPGQWIASGPGTGLVAFAVALTNALYRLFALYL